MRALNSGKIFLTAAFIILLPNLLQGAESGFSVSAMIGEQDMPTATAALKHQAVKEWLKAKLGDEFSNFESKFTPEFTEQYVLDYQVTKLSDEELQVTGHLDIQSLLGWVRLTETKSHGGGDIRPLFVVSSEIPEASLLARSTPSNVRSDKFAQTLMTLSTGTLAKFSIKLGTSRDARFPYSAPPQSESDIHSLRSFAAAQDFNSVLWLHFVPCAPCGGTKAQVYFYNLPQDRTLIAQTHNLKLAAADFQSSDKIKAETTEMFKQLGQDFEEMVSSGSLSSRIHQLEVKGVQSYQAYLTINKELESLDFVTEAVLSKTEPWTVHYEIMSPLPSSELLKKFEGLKFSAFRLEPKSVSSNNLVVQYVKLEK